MKPLVHMLSVEYMYMLASIAAPGTTWKSCMGEQYVNSTGTRRSAEHLLKAQELQKQDNLYIFAPLASTPGQSHIRQVSIVTNHKGF